MIISSDILVLFFSFIFYLCIRFNHNGEMQEWLNWLAWKASISQKGIGGSNPPFSAKRAIREVCSFFCEGRGDENPRVRQRRSRLPEQESPFLRKKKGLSFCWVLYNYVESLYIIVFNDNLYTYVNLRLVFYSCCNLPIVFRYLVHAKRREASAVTLSVSAFCHNVWASRSSETVSLPTS